MTPEQIAALLSVPGMAALIFIVVRQQSQIDKLQQANADLLKQLIDGAHISTGQDPIREKA